MAGRDLDRYKRAFDLRSAGLTFKKIGEQLAVGSERARQMVFFYERRVAPRPTPKRILVKTSALACPASPVVVFAECVAETKEDAIDRIRRNDPLWAGHRDCDFKVSRTDASPYLRFIGRRIAFSTRRTTGKATVVNFPGEGSRCSG